MRLVIPQMHESAVKIAANLRTISYFRPNPTKGASKKEHAAFYCVLGFADDHGRAGLALYVVSIVGVYSRPYLSAFGGLDLVCTIYYV